MRAPTYSIVAVGLLYLALGLSHVVRGLAPLFALGGPAHLTADKVLLLALGIAALIGGSFVLCGRNWARWLLVAWTALHVVISTDHAAQLIAHLAIFGVVMFLLFRPSAWSTFQRTVGR